MTITLNIPDEAEKTLRDAWGSHLDRAALEALAVEGYRSRKFGLSTVRRMLGFDELWERLRTADESVEIEAKRTHDIGKSVLETVCAFFNEPGRRLAVAQPQPPSPAPATPGIQASLGCSPAGRPSSEPLPEGLRPAQETWAKAPLARKEETVSARKAGESSKTG